MARATAKTELADIGIKTGKIGGSKGAQGRSRGGVVDKKSQETKSMLGEKMNTETL
jgi:hypothetical protein